MARSKSKGFNSPFEKLKAGPKDTPAKPSTPTAVTPQAPGPTKSIPAGNTAKDPAPAQGPIARADEDRELFLRAVHGAQPVRKGPATGRVAPPKPVPTLRATDDQLALAELQNLVAGQGEFRVSESEEMHTGLAAGVSFQLLEQLQKGDFAFHRHLDLHGMSRDVAHDEIARFVTVARRDGERCVLIITGRGKSSPNGIAVLRDALPRWLSRSPLRAHVLAFCTARAVDGGPGAFYVLLRRSGVKPYGASHV